jgi:hypothetical protein
MNIRDLADHESPANGLIKGRSSPDDLANCHAEGRGFESHQPLFRECPAHGRAWFDARAQNQLEPSLHIAVISGTNVHGLQDVPTPKAHLTSILRAP